MPTIAKQITEQGFGEQRNTSILWETLVNGDDGSPAIFPSPEKRSIQITGTFGVGGNVIIEGSNDGVNYVTLDDTENVALGTITIAGIYQIRDTVKYIRPRVSAGDGTTDLDATLVAA